MKKMGLVMSLVLAIMMVGSIALAGPGGWGGRFYGIGSAVSNLTPEQSSQILQLQQKIQEKSLAYQANARNVLTPQQVSQLPPGRGLGFAAGTGYGRGMGYGAGYGSYGRGGGMGRGMGYGRAW